MSKTACFAEHKACAALLACAIGLSACAATVYSVPAGERIYGGYAVTVDGVRAPVSEVRCSAIPFNRRWPGHQRQIEQTELCGMVRFALSGKATVAVTADRDFKTAKVRPLSRAVAVRRAGRTVTFDDTFCFKAHEGYGNCEDGVFERCVAWNDWGKALDEKHRPENVVFEGCAVDGRPVRGRDDVTLSLNGPAAPPTFKESTR